MKPDPVLVDQLRALLADERDVEEQRMMGALRFMVGGHLCCGVFGHRLMARVGVEAYADSLTRAGVEALDLGGRRPNGYVLVDFGLVSDTAGKREWLDRALTVVSDLPPRQRRPKRPLRHSLA